MHSGLNPKYHLTTYLNMKFFTNLPKTTFESTAGSFTISDFFTYLDIVSTQVQEAPVLVDDKSTLIEAANTVYGDPNSFWAFVAANNIVNPFTLLSENTFIFEEDTTSNINLTLLPTPTAITGGTCFNVGSLILPYAGNSGATFSLGFTGNFNLNSGFAIIEQASFYDGNMVIGPQSGITQNFITVGATAELVTVLRKTDVNSYVWGGTFYTGNKKLYSDKVIYQTLIKDGKTIYKEATSSNPTLDTYLPYSTPIDGVTTYVQTKASTNNTNKNKQIQAYVPNQIGLIQASFVSANYI